jgi:putative inorganic carbon (hco3(-)) transporter
MRKSLLGKNSAINFSNVNLSLILLIGSLAIAFLVGRQGYVVGALIVVVIVGIPFIVGSFQETTFGLFVLIGYSYFLFFIARLLLPTKVPLGVGVEALELVILAGILIGSFAKKKINWALFRNPVTFAFLFFEFYIVLQALNPNAVSLVAWIVTMRTVIFDILLYFIFGNLFTSKTFVVNFTKFWLFLSLLAAFYGIYQEMFGYHDFEWFEINSSPETIGLIKNGNFLRKFSFLSDVATFGIVMAYSSIFCAVLSMAPFGLKARIALAACSLLMMTAMSFSGTRTATAMIPVGAVMYILLNINNKSTVVILMGLVLTFVAILYGPFYGGVATRLRTTFQPSKDPSNIVREVNRGRIQPYIFSHPIGGGVGTTDGEGKVLAAGHYLAGFPTDNGFLKTALTMGWIGLIIQLGFYFTVMAMGIKNFFLARDPIIKVLYCGYVSVFFALVIANFTQFPLVQKPTSLIAIFIFILMPNLIKFDKNKERTSPI